MSLRRLHNPRASRLRLTLVTLASLAMLACGSSDSDNNAGDGDGDVDDDDDEDPFAGGTRCFPDADGLTGSTMKISLTVTDTGFSRNVISTQDNTLVELTLKNEGDKPHGFLVGCASVEEEYPNAPEMCPKVMCFPGSTPDEDGNAVPDADADMPAWMDPIEPGESKTIMFLTPLTDNIIYPISSNSPDDEDVEGLNNGQWTIM